MIVRIMGEGQFEISDEAVDRLNALDRDLEAHLGEGRRDDFTATLERMLEIVRSEGKPLEDDELVSSAAILPPANATVEQLRELLRSEEGLIPGS